MCLYQLNLKDISEDKNIEHQAERQLVSDSLEESFSATSQDTAEGDSALTSAPASKTDATDAANGKSTGSLKDIVNTPFKKAMFIVQILSYVLIVGSPLIGGAIGGLLKLKTAQTGGLILGVFIAGEILFYGSLIFLGKEVVNLLRTKMRSWIKRRRARP